MDQSTFWLISALLSGTAIVISLASLLNSRKSGTIAKETLLKSLKSEALAKVYERTAKQRHLISIYALHLDFYHKTNHEDKQETDRIKNNVAITYNSVNEAEKYIEHLRQCPTTSIEAWNDILSHANGFLIEVSEELEKERYAFEQLKAYKGI